MYAFRYITQEEMSTVAPSLFRILSANMGDIAPTGNTYEEDYSIWTSYVLSPAFWEHDRQVILMLSGERIAGYFQYSINGDTLTIDEIEIDKKYQCTALFRRLLIFLKLNLPTSIKYIEAYVNKDNINSQRITEKFSLEVTGENKSGRSLHYRGKCEKILEKLSRIS